jgi:hypothetical protein
MSPSTTLQGKDARGRQVALLVEPSVLRRAALSRALIAAGFDVRSLESLGAAETPRFAMVNLEDLNEGDADTLLAALLEAHHDLPLILRSSDPSEAEEGARTLGLNVALSFAKDALEREVIAQVSEWCRSGLAGEDSGRKSFERLAPAALKRVPALVVERGDLGWYESDADQASFLASVDGRRNLEAIATCTGLAPSVVLSVAQTLVEEGVVAFDS